MLSTTHRNSLEMHQRMLADCPNLEHEDMGMMADYEIV